MAEASFTAVCQGCGAEARNLSLVGLFTAPLLCPSCQRPEVIDTP